MSEYRSYTEQMTVLDGDSDFRRCLKPSALFRYVEQVSADHARAYGMDHAFFRERRQLKHGTISLIEPGTLVIGVLTQSDLYEKTISNMLECREYRQRMP